MDLLGRYYTSEKFSKLLINQFSNEIPENIIDLGVGGGALLRAAIDRWINASYFAADVDKRSIIKIKSELPFVNSFHLDTLKDEVSEKIQLQKGNVDIAICNPPFLKIKNESSYESLFKEANLFQCQELKRLTSDIIFLAKNLQLLKNKGELGIILPDSLITGKEFIPLRNAILQQHNLRGIIELPESIFAKTEALTHILIIEKNGNTDKKSPLFLSDKTGKIIDQIEVDKNSLSERMDFKYHLWEKKCRSQKKHNFLHELKVEIKRGTLTHKVLKETRDNFIHTTNMIDKKMNQSLSNSYSTNEKFLMTRKGDILLARVGRGCIGKVCMITKGRVPISDCIYRIRVPEKYRIKVWNALISFEGQNWLRANAHGVCAKVISIKDLYNLPI